MLNIVVIHPDMTLVQTLKKVILQEPDWFLLRHEANFDSFHQSFPKRARIDIAIIHSNEIDRIHDLKSLSNQVKIIVICDMEIQIHAMKAFYTGADGYLISKRFQADINYYLNAIIAGGVLISATIARHLINSLTIPSPEKGDNCFNLRIKEVEVIYLLSLGHSYDKVASILGITKNGVRFHIKKIYIALNVHNRMDAVRKWENQQNERA